MDDAVVVRVCYGEADVLEDREETRTRELGASAALPFLHVLQDSFKSLPRMRVMTM